MSHFSYVARDQDGRSVTGALEAPSAEAARASLREMDLHVDLLEHGGGERSAEPEKRPAEAIVSWTARETPAAAPASERDYFPLVDTLRLYAGWLLAWYFIIYSFGYYQSTRPLPLRIPLIDELYASPMILSFSVAAFLFLLLSSIHRLFGRGVLLGIGLSIVGIIAFWLFQSNA